MEPKNPFECLSPVDTVVLKKLKTLLCVDNSGSTDNKFGSTRVIDCEKSICNIFKTNFNCYPFLIQWNSQASLANISALEPSGGTDPSSIFECLDFIKSSKNIIIITDGQIEKMFMIEFGKKMIKEASHIDMFIGIIAGPYAIPHEINISVLLPGTISNSLILYCVVETGKMYLVWCSDNFYPIFGEMIIQPSTKLEELPEIDVKKLSEINIQIYKEHEWTNLTSMGYIPYGNGRFWHPDYLLDYRIPPEELSDFIEKIPIERFCQYYRIFGNYDKLINRFKQIQSEYFNSLNLNENDKELIILCIKQISQRKSKKNSRIQRTISDEHKAAFINYRNFELFKKYNDANLLSHITNEKVVKCLKIFHNIITAMEIDAQTSNLSHSYSVASINRSTYISGSQNSSLDMSASLSFNYLMNNLSFYPSGKFELSFCRPFEWYDKNRSITYDPGSCSICFEDNIMMFFLVNQKIMFDNQNKLKGKIFDYLYNSPVCYKCSEYFVIKCGKNPIHMACIGALPIIPMTTMEMIYSYQKASQDLICFPESMPITQLLIMMFSALQEKFDIEVTSSNDPSHIIHSALNKMIMSMQNNTLK
jgi:hypothetical protein